MRKLIAILAAVGVAVILASPGAAAGPSTLIVPTEFPTIQSAVNAASPGDTVQVLPGTYVEQITVSKNLTLTGSGEGSTFIQAPATTLTPDSFGRTYIVEINNAAVVTMSGFTVTGPGPGDCRSLNVGISVVSGAALQLSASVVTHIHGSPRAFCFFSGFGIVVGLPRSIGGGTSGHATIENVNVNDYDAVGIALVGAGTTGTVSDDQVAGSTQSVVNAGIVVRSGAVASVTDNTVSGNLCNVPSFGCGTDWFTQTQGSGILALNAGAGTVISDNNVLDNDVGIIPAFGSGCCTTSDNKLTNNGVAGIAIADGTNTASDNSISGGMFGILVAAISANTVGILSDNTITGTSVAAVQALSCCGFTATAVQN